LKELAIDEAALLNWMYVQRVGLGHGAFQTIAMNRLFQVPNEFDAPFPHGDLVEAFCSLGFGIFNQAVGGMAVEGMGFETCLWNLDSKKLIQVTLTGKSDYLKASLTFHGGSFAQACQPPKPKS
jgi:hypothetical protein